ncbi:MAG: C39 family peptidase [Clostridia bacterium]|nr:C39 family peptidase [Clostridia bacterium]
MKKLIDVPYLDQSEDAPTGCEAVSTVMLLQYLGYDTNIQDFIDHDLPRGDFETIDGELYAPNPNDVFVGDPYGADAMGCYAPVLTSLLDQKIGDKYVVTNETGTGIDALCKKYIDQDMPVLLWITINLRPYIEGPSWKLIGSGETFTWRSNEHCLLLVGYDDEHFIFNDPWENRGVIACEKEICRIRHAEQYSMAVGIQKRA